jgi:hypothetical protein
MNLFRKDVHQVFTPRSPEVNPEMYIARPGLEEDLQNALAGTLNILIHGESGCGKSWLYKQVLAKSGAHFAAANLANASRLGSITKEMANLLARSQKPEKTGYSETKQAEGSLGIPGVGGAKAIVNHTSEYEVPEKDPLEACLAMIRKEAGGRSACLVLDNLEAIFGQAKLMKELGDIITLLDDPNYSAYKVKLIIVGIPADVLDYFTRSQNRLTIANRIYEIREVGALTLSQIDEFVRKGFVDELKIHFEGESLKVAQEHIVWITMGIPQCLHEYCLEVALLCKVNDWRFEEKFLAAADEKWLRSGLSTNYAAVTEMMNERDTSAGRRNQVLYCLGKVASDTLRHSDVEEILRKEFPNSTTGITLNVPAVLAEIGKGTNPAIKRTPKGDSYRFVAPRFRMCIRTMLVKNGDKVAKIDLSKL